MSTAKLFSQLPNHLRDRNYGYAIGLSSPGSVRRVRRVRQLADRNADGSGEIETALLCPVVEVERKGTCYREKAAECKVPVRSLQRWTCHES